MADKENLDRAPVLGTWRCIAAELPAAHRADCDAKGEGDKGAEAHTKATGHATMTTIRRQP